MGTRARIGIEYTDNTILSVYLNYDGYPEHVMARLKHYATEDAVKSLIRLGDLSELDDTPDTCVAYFRDRCESWQ